MIHKHISALIFFLALTTGLYAQGSHSWLPVTLNKLLEKTMAPATSFPSIAAASVDSLYFSTHDTLKGFSTDMGRGVTTGVFFTVPNEWYPIKITSLVVNIYGGSASSGELLPADLLAYLWKNVSVPTDIGDSTAADSSFTQTISNVSVDQFLPVQFVFNDTASISTPVPFAVGIRYAGTTADTAKCISPGFGNPPAAYSDFYIDSTRTDTSVKAVYYDHSTYWTNPAQIGNMSAYITVEANMVGTGITEERWHFPDTKNVIENYPNPFNPETVIRVTSPVTGKAQIEIYNILGQKVYSMNAKVKSGVSYSFQWAPGNNSSGFYFVTVSVGKDRYFHKMSYLK